MNKIAVIDLDSVAYSIGHGIKLLDEKQQPIKVDNKFTYRDKTAEELKSSADQVMTSILVACGATHFIGYMKGYETTKFRLVANPDYKGNRSKEEPWWWGAVQLDLHKRWGAHYVNGMEVDDAVNITRLALKDAFIVAIDGDLLGLEGTHYQWRIHGEIGGKWVTTTEEQAFWKFWSDMIVGQPGDNIKGIPGKGEAYAKRLLGQPRMEGLAGLTFQAYTSTFGIDKGVREFYKNYISLKILDSQESFLIPQPQSVQEQLNKMIFN